MVDVSRHILMDALGNRIDKGEREPAHVQVRARLLRLLDEGSLRAGDKLPPKPQLAERLGVSRMTANKAILGLVAEGRLVRAKGRGTFVAAPETGLSHCAFAVYHDITYALQDYYFGALYWGVHARLTEAGVATSLVRGDLAEPVADPRRATIAVNPREGDLNSLPARAVVLGASWPGVGLPSVDSDNVRGATLAVDHLIDLGHRKVAFLGACPDTSNTRDRLWGFRDALGTRGLLPSGEAFSREALGIGEVAEALLLDLVEAGTTAVFAAGPRLALSLLALAGRAGLRVPDDLSIVGYDDPDFLALAYPAITTVRQPLAEMASRACDLLLADPFAAPRAPVLLQPRLVVRGSTAPPASPSYRPT